MTKEFETEESNSGPEKRERRGVRYLYKKVCSYTAYGYRITAWRLLTLFRRTVAWVARRSGFFRRLLVLLVGLCLAHGVVSNINISSVPSATLSSYLIAVGAMIGGILAIVFTLSIFAQQNAADLYSSQYYEVYTHDWKEKFTYAVVVVIVLLFFSAGILIGGEPQKIPQRFIAGGVYLSLVLIGITFILVDWQHKNVRDKANPLTALVFLERQAHQFLDNVHKDARRIAQILKTKYKDATEEQALASAYNNYLSPRLSNLDRQIENLFEISMKLSEKQEVKTTNRGIAAVHNILAKYFEVRKNSSLIMPTYVYFLATTSDSRGFLGQSYERLNNSGERFVREHRTENAAYIVSVYESLARNAQGIEFLGGRSDNPIFDQIKGYFLMYLEFAIREKDQEVVFQGAKTLRRLAAMAMEKGWSSTLFGLQGDLAKVVMFGITEKKTFILDECNSGWLQIIGGVFTHQYYDAQSVFRKSLSHIQATTSLIHRLMAKGYLPQDFGVQASLTKPYDDLPILLGEVVNRLFQSKDDDEKSFCRSRLLTLFEELHSSLRTVSEEVKECDGLLAGSIGRLLAAVNELIISLLGEDEPENEDYGFVNLREKLYRLLRWNLHLPSWFVHHAESFHESLGFDDLTDSIATTGISLFELPDSNETIFDSIQGLWSVVRGSLEKLKGSGYDEPRIMEKLVYIGILALKHNRQALFIEVGMRIYEFEEQYKNKYFANFKVPEGLNPEMVMGPKKDQLFREVFRWRESLRSNQYNRSPLMDTAKDRIYTVITEDDVDRFMLEVWECVPANSLYLKKIQRKDQIEKCLLVLRNRIRVMQDSITGKA